jgi:adenine deaminase
MTRKDFLKILFAAATTTLFPQIYGCSSASYRNVPEPDYTNGLLFENCNLIDVINGKLLKNISIFIKDGKIVSIHKNGSINFPSVQKVDIKNMYVIPGLIDSHCHSTISPVFFMNTMDVFKHHNQ